MSRLSILRPVRCGARREVLSCGSTSVRTRSPACTCGAPTRSDARLTVTMTVLAPSPSLPDRPQGGRPAVPVRRPGLLRPRRRACHADPLAAGLAQRPGAPGARARPPARLGPRRHASRRLSRHPNPARDRDGLPGADPAPGRARSATTSLPLKIGARNMAFPVADRAVVLALPGSAASSCCPASSLPGGAAATGWTAYPPLSAIRFNGGGYAPSGGPLSAPGRPCRSPHVASSLPVLLNLITPDAACSRSSRPRAWPVRTFADRRCGARGRRRHVVWAVQSGRVRRPVLLVSSPWS